MIQNSLDLQTRFREAVRRLHPRLKRPTANLRAAKHRFETFSKPLARTCSTFLAIVDVMNYTAIHGKSRKGFDSKAAAKQWIRWVTRCPGNILCSAMLADAADEASEPLRYFDSEGFDITIMHEMLSKFIGRIEFLYGDVAHCLTVNGYTKLMLDFLKDCGSQHVHVQGGSQTIHSYLVFVAPRPPPMDTAGYVGVGAR